jgi:predicted MFS family arabinose efflux permease
MLLIIRMLMGVFEGPVLPIAQSMMAVESSESRRGFNMGLLQSSSTSLLASVLGPIFIVALANAFGWRNTFFYTIIPGIILFIWIWKSVKEPQKLANETVAAETSKEKVRLIDMLKNKNILISIILSSFYIAWYIELYTFSPLYLTSIKQVSPSAMSFIFSALGLGGVLWGFGVPAISDRFGRKPVMIIFSFISALAPLGFIVLDGSSLWLLALVGFIGNVGVGAMVLYMSTIPSESISPKYVATAIGLIVAVGELIGGVLGSTLAGMAGDKFGLAATLWISFGCAVIAALLSFFYYETAPIKVKKSLGGPISDLKHSV